MATGLDDAAKRNGPSFSPTGASSIPRSARQVFRCQTGKRGVESGAAVPLAPRPGDPRPVRRTCGGRGRTALDSLRPAVAGRHGAGISRRARTGRRGGRLRPGWLQTLHRCRRACRFLTGARPGRRECGLLSGRVRLAGVPAPGPKVRLKLIRKLIQQELRGSLHSCEKAVGRPTRERLTGRRCRRDAWAACGAGAGRGRGARRAPPGPRRRAPGVGLRWRRSR